MNVPQDVPRETAISEEPVWRVTNRYSAEGACKFCDGVVHHQPWCRLRNATVAYCFLLVEQAQFMTRADLEHLHGMGIAWENR